MLSVCDIVQGIFFVAQYIMGGAKECQFWTSFGIAAALMQFITTTCIAYFVWVMVHKTDGKAQGPYARVKVALLALSYPAVTLMLIGFFFPGALTETPTETGWCFIPFDHPAPRIIAIYVPLSVCWIVTGGLYYQSKMTVWSYEQRVGSYEPQSRLDSVVEYSATATSPEGTVNPRHTQYRARRTIKELQRRLLLIPLWFIVLRLPGFVYRVAELSNYLVHSHQPLPDSWKWLSVAMAIGDPLQGVVNGYLFVFGVREVREYWYYFLCVKNGDEVDRTEEGNDAKRPVGFLEESNFSDDSEFSSVYLADDYNQVNSGSSTVRQNPSRVAALM